MMAVLSGEVRAKFENSILCRVRDVNCTSTNQPTHLWQIVYLYVAIQRAAINCNNHKILCKTLWIQIVRMEGNGNSFTALS